MPNFQDYVQKSTKKVLGVLELAVSEMASIRQSTLTPDFILLALLSQPDSEAVKIRERLLPDPREAVARTLDALRSGHPPPSTPGGRPRTVHPGPHRDGPPGRAGPGDRPARVPGRGPGGDREAGRGRVRRGLRRPPLRREVERQVENPLAMKIVKGECRVRVGVAEGEVVFEVEAPAPA